MQPLLLYINLYRVDKMRSYIWNGDGRNDETPIFSPFSNLRVDLRLGHRKDP